MFKALGMGVLGVALWTWVAVGPECQSAASSACDIPIGAWICGGVVFILTLISLSKERNG